MYGQMHIRPNFKKFLKLPCAVVFSASCSGVLYFHILLYVSCRCVIYVVEYGAYVGNTHDLIGLKMCTLQHGHDGKEEIQTDSLETICPT